MVRKIVKLILIVCWMGLIFLFSNDTGVVSTKKSDGFIIKFIENVIRRDLNDQEKNKWKTYLVKPVRKGAHLAVYFVLGLLIFNFIREFISAGYKSIFLSIGISFLYACSDEFHQLFISGRSGQINDVLLDTIGASAGVLLFSLIVRKCSKYEQKERVS